MLEGSARPRWMVIYDHTGKALIVLNFVVLLVSVGVEVLGVWPVAAPKGALLRLALGLGSVGLWLLLAVPRVTSGQGILLFGGPAAVAWALAGPGVAFQFLVLGLVAGVVWNAIRRWWGSPPPPRPLLEQLFVRTREHPLARVFE